MGIFNLFTNTDDVVVTTRRSKAESKEDIDITVGMIKEGIARDSDGYPNEIAFFLRKAKKDR